MYYYSYYDYYYCCITIALYVLNICAQCHV